MTTSTLRVSGLAGTLLADRDRHRELQNALALSGVADFGAGEGPMFGAAAGLAPMPSAIDILGRARCEDLATAGSLIRGSLPTGVGRALSEGVLDQVKATPLLSEIGGGVAPSFGEYMSKAFPGLGSDLSTGGMFDAAGLSAKAMVRELNASGVGSVFAHEAGSIAFPRAARGAHIYGVGGFEGFEARRRETEELLGRITGALAPDLGGLGVKASQALRGVVIDNSAIEETARAALASIGTMYGPASAEGVAPDFGVAIPGITEALGALRAGRPSGWASPPLESFISARRWQLPALSGLGGGMFDDIARSMASSLRGVDGEALLTGAAELFEATPAEVAPELAFGSAPTEDLDVATRVRQMGGWVPRGLEPQRARQLAFWLRAVVVALSTAQAVESGDPLAVTVATIAWLVYALEAVARREE